MFHANVPFNFGVPITPPRVEWASICDNDSDTDIEQLSVEAKSELRKRSPVNSSAVVANEGFQGHSSRR